MEVGQLVRGRGAGHLEVGEHETSPGPEVVRHGGLARGPVGLVVQCRNFRFFCFLASRRSRLVFFLEYFGFLENVLSRRVFYFPLLVLCF